MMVRMQSVLLLASTVLRAGTVSADAVIQSVQTSGSGCPGGNGIGVSIDAPNNIITLSNAPEFKIQVGNSPGRKNKNCQAMISVSVAPNEQFTVLQSDFPAWARLDTGVTASIMSNFFFQSNAAGGVSEVQPIPTVACGANI
jgi:uncharacterized protein DUF4360